MRRGRLIGIGVGPGDPELMTLKGVRALERVQLVAFIAAAGRSSRAREIVGSFLRPGTRELVAVMPMSGDREATRRVYAQLATGILSELGQGHDVAYLCEGDPLLYGSFIHLMAALGERFACEVIPGISAMAAAAAATSSPLAVGEEALLVVPATLPQARLGALIGAAERVVLVKLGRHLGKVRRALAQAGMLEGALLIENVGTGRQRIRRLVELRDEEEVPYFALVLASRARHDG